MAAPGRTCRPKFSAGGNATTITSASANDSTCAVRDTAQGSRNRTITGSIRALFRSAAKAVTDADDEPPPERRRDRKEGDRDGGMMRFALRFSRLFAAKRARPQQTAQVEDVREGFRTERAAITRPGTMQDHDAFGAATAYLSDTLDWMNPYWHDDAGSGTELKADLDTAANYLSPRL